MLNYGLLITINSDDPAYNDNQYIGDNYYLVVKEYQLGLMEIETLARNSFRSSFMAPDN